MSVSLADLHIFDLLLPGVSTAETHSLSPGRLEGRLDP